MASVGPGPVVTIISDDIRSGKVQKYKQLCRDLGIVEIFLGIISIGLSVAALNVIDNTDYWKNDVTHVASGVWSGMVVIISGSLAIIWKPKNSKSLLNLNLIMSIMASVFAGFGFIISLYASFVSKENNHLVRIHAFLALVSFLALIICILHASYTCATKCCFPWLSTGGLLYSTLPRQYVRLSSGQVLFLGRNAEANASSSHQNFWPLPPPPPLKCDDQESLPPAYVEEP